MRIFGSSTPSSLIPIGRATLRWGSGPQGLLSSEFDPEALDPRAKPVPLPQAEGLSRTLAECDTQLVIADSLGYGTYTNALKAQIMSLTMGIRAYAKTLAE